MTDRSILYAAAFVRALATGMIGVLMGVYLAHLAFDPARVGYVVGAGLFGCAAAALLVTLVGDHAGRRRSLLGVSLLAVVGGAAFAFTGHPFAAGLAAFLGMVNGMGRDRGAALIPDQGLLPATVGGASRRVNTRVSAPVPSALLRLPLAFAQTFAVGALLFLLRGGELDMAVPPR